MPKEIKEKIIEILEKEVECYHHKPEACYKKANQIADQILHLFAQEKFKLQKKYGLLEARRKKVVSKIKALK